MNAETLRDNLQAVLPETEIIVETYGTRWRVRSAMISAGGTEADSVILHCEEL